MVGKRQIRLRMRVLYFATTCVSHLNKCEGSLQPTVQLQLFCVMSDGFLGTFLSTAVICSQLRLGVYCIRKAPHQWPDVAAIIDNNFRNMYRRDVALKGREVADQENVSLEMPLCHRFCMHLHVAFLSKLCMSKWRLSVVTVWTD